MFVPHRKQPYAVYYGDCFKFLYVDDVRTSQEIQTYIFCYGDNFAFL
jgi:hypothetical protein